MSAESPDHDPELERLEAELGARLRRELQPPAADVDAVARIAVAVTPENR